MLNILSGEDQQFEGTLKIGQTVKVAYFKQTEETLNRDIRMIDYLREESEVAKEKDGTTVSITQLLERFLFPSSTHGKRFISYLAVSKSDYTYCACLCISQTCYY